MSSKLYFLLFCIFLGGHIWAQSGVPEKSGLSEPVVGASAASNTALQPTLDVLFATNADCRLFINAAEKGTLSKDRFLYVKLAPGVYHYIAKSTTTGDEWRDTFSVADTKPNEVFVDMLFTMDAAKELAAKSKTSPAQNASSTTGKEAGSDQAFVASVLAAMVPVTGGTFVMGNNKSPSSDEAEHPVLLQDFFMSKYEVTQAQWERVMGTNPSTHKNCPDCPVENVSWEDAMVFIRKLNGISPRKFRLPTEAEWEYVARMGGKAEIDRAGGAEAYIKKTAWAFVNSDGKTHPVGQKQPNVAGIYDLFGNVSEWCMDWYGAFYYKEDYTEKDPEGPPLGREKIVRGGNYKDYAGDRFRPSFRNKMDPKTTGSEIGLRLVTDGQN